MLQEIVKYLPLFDVTAILLIIFLAGKVYQRLDSVEKSIKKIPETYEILVVHGEQINNILASQKRRITVLDSLTKDYNEFRRDCARTHGTDTDSRPKYTK